MKLPSLKLVSEVALNALPLAITLGFLFKSLTLTNLMISFGIALVAMAVGCNYLVASVICSLTLLLVTYHGREGFTSTPTSISARVKKLKEGFMEKEEDEEAFRDKEDEEEGFKEKEEEEEGYKSYKDDEEEGFMNMKSVFQNITTAGYTSPGFGMGAPLVEGFEDTKPKPETKSKPAPVAKKEEMAMPFKLGEIPSQVKNGPHIDASSTLMKAIHSLNPDQINAMTKDTKQLIETQKSLMGMLGTMKPMMNDGKELMETFQEMFGKQ
jgi:hypothetical protein